MKESMAQSAVHTDPVELVDRAYKDLVNGKFEEFMSVFDDGSELIEPESLPYGGAAKGAAAIGAKIEELMSLWSEFDVKIDTVAGSGDRVLAYGQLDATSRATGTKVSMPLAEVWEIRGGKVATLRPFYFDTGKLLDAMK